MLNISKTFFFSPINNYNVVQIYFDLIALGSLKFLKIIQRTKSPVEGGIREDCDAHYGIEFEDMRKLVIFWG